MELRKVGHAAATFVYQAGETVVGFTFEFVKTLGERGSDGFPYIVRLTMAAAKVFEGIRLQHAAAQVVIVTSKAFKPAIDVISCITTPFVDFGDTIDSVQDAMQALQGRAEEKRKFEVQYMTVDDTPLPADVRDQFPTLQGDMTVKKEGKVVAGMAVAQAFADVSVYFSGICEAASKLAALEALPLADSTLKRLAQVGGGCFSVFAIIGATGSVVKFGFAAADYLRAGASGEEELKVLKAAAKVALANVIKTAIKVTMMVFTTHFSLAAQGIAALSVIALDIYVSKLKPQSVSKQTFVHKLPEAAYSPGSSRGSRSSISGSPSRGSIGSESPAGDITLGQPLAMETGASSASQFPIKHVMSGLNVRQEIMLSQQPVEAS